MLTLSTMTLIMTAFGRPPSISTVALPVEFVLSVVALLAMSNTVSMSHESMPPLLPLVGVVGAAVVNVVSSE